MLELNGCIVTLDAMGCQKDIAARIVDKGAHYVLALKGNHATVHQEVADFFTDAVAPLRYPMRRCFLSSLPLHAQHFGRAVRAHWGVENPLHWTLDVTFREDDSRARTKNAAQNVATLRRIALNPIKKNPRQKVSQGQKRILAALDTHSLEQLLGIQMRLPWPVPSREKSGAEAWEESLGNAH
ncbi:MAG TPA: ISAs1 family transposase [Candidatus Hydrogenedentes bacterium]|nr:ISAs1 family transposase [Candidatus Hydrogenedentota bacterium]